MHCHHCGEKMPDDARFCRHCGNEVAEQTGQHADEYGSEQTGQYEGQQTGQYGSEQAGQYGDEYGSQQSGQYGDQQNSQSHAGGHTQQRERTATRRQGGTQSQPPAGSSGTYRQEQSAGGTYKNLSLLFSTIGFIFVPIIFGPLGIYFGHKYGKSHPSQSGNFLILYGIFATIGGMMLGLLLVL